MTDGLDSDYVKLHLENILTELMAELVQVQPTDPIEWLANALRHHSRKVKAKEVNRISEKIFGKLKLYLGRWNCSSSIILTAYNI